MSSHDIRSILDRLAVAESQATSAYSSNVLNSQPKSVPQLPALFKPRHIRVLGSKTDPQHPMADYQVGAEESTEPRKLSLEEAMQEVEEDMLSKVKRDLTTYLDRLEKKVAISRDLKDKAKDAVAKGRAEEDVEEDDHVDSETGHDIDYAAKSSLDAAQKPIQVVAMEDGIMCEIHKLGDEYEIQLGGRRLPSRFKNSNDAEMAISLFRARRAAHQRPNQDLGQDYIQER